MKQSIGILLIAALLSGCATSFSGSAKVDGPDQCRRICKKWDMTLAGMIALGDYTDGCICRVKDEKISLNDIGQSLLMSSAGSAGGAAAVFMQMQEDKNN